MSSHIIEKGPVMIVRVHMRALRNNLERQRITDEKRRRTLVEIHERAHTISFDGDIMSFIVVNMKEKPNGYTVEFKGQKFELSKRNLGDLWYRLNDIYEFRLCRTAREFWNAFRGFYLELMEQVTKASTAQPISDWEPTGEI